jgi:membrane protein implicated in regulation of membrane protease activity
MNAEPYLIWFLAGLVLVLLEFAAPGVIIVFIGLGAWAASLTTWLGWTPTMASQLAVFATASVVFLVGLRNLCKSWFMGLSKNGDASATDEEFLDREVRVVTAITPDSSGKVEFKGASWNARSTATLKPGDMAVIVERDGLLLTVRPR